ncbi:Serine/threonine-protein kinase PknK [compost metagenome]
MLSDKLLVTTKFAPPRISAQSISRQRLLDELKRMEHCSVGLIVGSPGFGKTTLLVQWRQAMMKDRSEIAWLSLSAEDKHLGSFFVYLLAALQRLGVPLENEIPLEGSSGESVDSVVAAIVEGAAAVDKELYLILDDYQNVTDPRAHRFMQKLLDHGPANLHFLIASRSVPPLSVSRLRLMGQVVELDCAGLPFDLAETRAFLDLNLSAQKLTAEEVHLIHDLTSGWPASLQLVVLLLRGRPEARKSLRDLGWKSDDLQTYLAEDVIAHLPAELARFMESVSICRRFNASLAAAVTNNDQAADLLQRLEEENLLIFRVEADDRQPWYRFHPLFSEFLATRLARRDIVGVAELHRRASRWLAERKLLAEAVRHATLGGDLEFAAELVERSAPVTWGLDQVGPLLRLLDRLPQDVLFSRPRLFFIGCLAYVLTARPAKAEAWLEAYLRSGASQDAEDSQRLRTVQAAIAIQRDDSERIIELLEGDIHPLADDYSVMRYGPSAMLAIAYSAAGRHADALRCLDDLAVPDVDRDDEMALVAEGARTHSYLLAGRMAEAERIGSDLLARSVAAHGHRSISAYVCAASMAEVYCETDRIDEAREVLANRVGLLQWAMPDTMLRATLCRARLDLLQESPDATLAFLERQERHFRNLGQDRAFAHCLAEQVRVLLAEGRASEIGDRVERLEALAQAHQSARGFLAEIPMLAALTRARVLQAGGNYEESLEPLGQVRDFARQYHRGQVDVTATLLMAIAEGHLRRQGNSQALLGEALERGHELGLARTFIDEDAALGKLLTAYVGKIPAQSPLADYLDELLARFKRGDEGSHASLSPREVAIMQLVSQAMSNKRIALALNISLETVKWNLKNIYAKLGVSSRYDAMSWARKHGLIR